MRRVSLLNAIPWLIVVVLLVNVYGPRLSNTICPSCPSDMVMSLLQRSDNPKAKEIAYNIRDGRLSIEYFGLGRCLNQVASYSDERISLCYQRFLLGSDDYLLSILVHEYSHYLDDRSGRVFNVLRFEHEGRESFTDDQYVLAVREAYFSELAAYRLGCASYPSEESNCSKIYGCLEGGYCPKVAEMVCNRFGCDDLAKEALRQIKEGR